MKIQQIIGLAFAAVVLINVLRPYKPELAVIISVLFGIAFFTYISQMTETLFEYIRYMCNFAGVKIIYIEILFKIIGISYICEFASAVCKDSGETSVALKIDIVGKLLILLSAMPVFVELLNLLVKLAP